MFAIQGEPDLESLQSFIFHWGDRELEQFTERYDSENKKIYENDLISYMDFILQVVFKKGMFILDVVKGRKGYFLFTDMSPNLLTKIGNIHEDFKLLNNAN